MSTDTKETIELELTRESHMSRRQELLKQLWRITKHEQEAAEERQAREMAFGHDHAPRRTLVES